MDDPASVKIVEDPIADARPVVNRHEFAPPFAAFQSFLIGIKGQSLNTSSSRSAKPRATEARSRMRQKREAASGTPRLPLALYGAVPACSEATLAAPIAWFSTSGGGIGKRMYCSPVCSSLRTNDAALPLPPPEGV